MNWQQNFQALAQRLLFALLCAVGLLCAGSARAADINFFNCPTGQFVTGFNQLSGGTLGVFCSTPFFSSNGFPVTLGSTSINSNASVGSLSGLTLVAPTISGNPIFNGEPTFNDLPVGTQVSCLGLDASNNLVLAAAACGSGGGGGTIVVGTTPISGGTSFGLLYDSGGVVGSTTAGTSTTLLHGNAAGAPSWSQVALGSDVSGNLPNSNLASDAANTLLGSLALGTPSGISVPSCGASNNALSWTSGTGFGCNTISSSGNVSTSGAITTGAIPLWASGTTVSGTLVPGTGITTWLATPSSANLAATVTGETGSGALVFGTSPSLTTPTIAGGALSGTFSGSPTFSGQPTFSNALTGTQANCLGTSSGGLLVASAGACGSGGATTITLNPGNGNSASSFNGLSTLQTVTNGSQIFAQDSDVSKTSAYTINADCNGGTNTCDTHRLVMANGASSIVLTAPNPAGTLGTYQMADQSGHGFTVPTVGGTATYVGCVSGTPTTLTVPANDAVQLYDLGSTNNQYFCIFTPQQGGGGAAFSAITGGTNTAAAMVVGTGASLAASGSGSITATAMAAAGLTGQVSVANGGTGLATWTSAAIPLGNGASSPTFLAPVNGDCVVGSAGAWTAGSCGGGGGGILDVPNYVAGNWYIPVTANVAFASGNTNVAGTIYCAPGKIEQTLTIETFGGRPTTVAAGGNFQLAIYNLGSWGRPGTLVAASNSMSTATVANVNATPVGGNFQVTAGNYWFCGQVDNATAGILGESAGTTQPSGAMLIGSTSQTPITNPAISGVSTTGTFGTWPNFTSGTTWTDVTSGVHVPLVGFQVVSVP